MPIYKNAVMEVKRQSSRSVSKTAYLYANMLACLNAYMLEYMYASMPTCLYADIEHDPGLAG
jgi:hypothetical protein